MNVGKGRDKSTRKKTLLLKSNDKELLTPLRKIIVLLVKDEDTHTRHCKVTNLFVLK